MESEYSEESSQFEFPSAPNSRGNSLKQPFKVPGKVIIPPLRLEEVKNVDRNLLIREDLIATPKKPNKIEIPLIEDEYLLSSGREGGNLAKQSSGWRDMVINSQKQVESSKKGGGKVENIALV